MLHSPRFVVALFCAGFSGLSIAPRTPRPSSHHSATLYEFRRYQHSLEHHISIQVIDPASPCSHPLPSHPPFFLPHAINLRAIGCSRPAVFPPPPPSCCVLALWSHAGFQQPSVSPDATRSTPTTHAPLLCEASCAAQAPCAVHKHLRVVEGDTRMEVGAPRWPNNPFSNKTNCCNVRFRPVLV